ncbi:MAG: aspartate/glutamate racemase family protein [Nitrospinota bacterium]|nr:aspartate/glutamate racemase family protein [Nitrospinota bacterium]
MASKCGRPGAGLGGLSGRHGTFREEGIMYGWRAVVGLIEPSGGPMLQEEVRRAAPEGVTFVGSRMYIEEVSLKGVEGMVTHVERAARDIAIMKADSVVLCGTPAGFFKGHAFNREVTERLEKASGLPSMTQISAVVEGLRLLGPRRIVVATAYLDELNERLRDFLEEAGFEVLVLKGLQQRYNWDIYRLPPSAAYRLTRDALKEAGDAEGIFISCGGMRTFDIIDTLERDLGLPVVTSNQAALWAGLRMGQVRESIEGYGQLLRKLGDADENGDV